MSKYYTFEQDFETMPVSKDNFVKAIIRIGQKDPLGVRKTSLCGHVPGDTVALTKKQYFNRGVLNVRKKLNSNLGLSGKYTNRMIRLSTEIEVLKIDNNYIWLKTKLPKKAFKDIVLATYNILNKCDKKLCQDLLAVEKSDKYIMKNFYSSKKIKTIAPIQTNMVIRSIVGKNESITAFVNEFRDEIIEVK